jgi:hypothetical protein
MSTVPEGSTSAQVIVLALTLTSYQRTILAKAGEARWFDLPHPWLPLPGSQETTARVLAEGEEALLAPVAGDLAQRLTPLQRSVLSHVAARGCCAIGTLFTRDRLVAHALALAEYQVLAASGMGNHHVFTLTPLGVQVVHLLAEVD